MSLRRLMIGASRASGPAKPIFIAPTILMAIPDVYLVLSGPTIG